MSQLQEVADLNPSLDASPADDEAVSFLPMSAVDADAVDAIDTETRPFREVRKGYTPFIADDVLVAKITPCFENGKIVQAKPTRRFGFGSTEFHVIRTHRSELDPRYLVYYLRQEKIRKDGERKMTGSAGQRRVPEHFLTSLNIPLPPLPEQRRIAEILDKADALRAKRRAALALLDTLTQSIFLDMFGDPATNPKGWPVFPLAEMCGIAGEYGAGVASKPYDPELPRYIRITDITDTGDLTRDAVSPSGDATEWGAYSLEPGDVLFARSGATVGKTYLHRRSDGRCVFAGYLIRFRAQPDRLLPEFLFQFTRTAAYRRWVAARQRVVAQPNINAQQYGEELRVPCPPLQLQTKLKERLNRIDRVHTEYQTAIVATEVLFASLQHRAFRGEL
jgi:type I restriction enzyme S subunit